jgi:hypothetical protein
MCHGLYPLPPSHLQQMPILVDTFLCTLFLVEQHQEIPVSFKTFDSLLHLLLLSNN